MPTDPTPHIALTEATSGQALEAVRGLFHDYALALGVDLSFQGFTEELATLPGDYAHPGGGLFLAWVDEQAAGCCAFRPLPDAGYPNACEMKRLYVAPAFRRFGLGRMLVDHTLAMARSVNYSHMLLDTLDDMEAARALYRDSGFVEIEPYYHNPLPGAHYLMVKL
ncbi:MAG: GNAT family N-acetyltransferase [Burkholderiaceae bacterium]|jgi:putative acetyltransferase|nr:GNAT family N-acetyltransferase [Candidatus Fonsibacter lacus]